MQPWGSDRMLTLPVFFEPFLRPVIPRTIDSEKASKCPRGEHQDQEKPERCEPEEDGVVERIEAIASRIAVDVSRKDHALYDQWQEGDELRKEGAYPSAAGGRAARHRE